MADRVVGIDRPVVNRDNNTLIHKFGILRGLDTDLGNTTINRIKQILQMKERTLLIRN